MTDMPAVPQLNKEQARLLTDAIRDALEDLWHLVTQAYLGRAWEPLGYESWDQYCSSELAHARLRLPLEERDALVGSFRRAGMSLRAISSVTGLGKTTVQRSLAGVPNGTPAIVGLDGHTYKGAPFTIRHGESDGQPKTIKVDARVLQRVESGPNPDPRWARGELHVASPASPDPMPWRRSIVVDNARRFTNEALSRMFELKLAAELDAAEQAGDDGWLERTRAAVSALVKVALALEQVATDDAHRATLTSETRLSGRDDGAGDPSVRGR